LSYGCCCSGARCEQVHNASAKSDSQTTHFLGASLVGGCHNPAQFSFFDGAIGIVLHDFVPLLCAVLHCTKDSKERKLHQPLPSQISYASYA
jgi:hypothetical protein